MIEGSRLPGSRIVAAFTSLRKTCRNVIRIRCLLKIFQVAGCARCVCAREIEVAVYVALAARSVRMGAGERKSSRCVIELHVYPVVHSVAAFASSGKSRRDVIGIGRLLEIIGVARIAVRGHCVELAQGAILVAGIALYRGVRSQ